MNLDGRGALLLLRFCRGDMVDRRERRPFDSLSSTSGDL